MHALRRARLLAQPLAAWVLALFVGAFCVTVASPAINPVSMELICSASGEMKVLFKSEDGTSQEMSHTVHCPLCVTASAPPSHPQAIAVSTQPLFYAVQAIPAARIAAIAGAPLPARGPPALA